MKANLTLCRWVFLSCLLSSFSLLASPANGNSFFIPEENLSIACNDHVQVSVDENCQAVLTADMILEGGGDDTEYTLTVLNGVTELMDLDGGNINNFIVGEDFLDVELTVRVIEIATDNFCWGAFTMEDKAAPVVTCTDLMVLCTDDLPAFGTGITVTDNCSVATLEIVDESTNTDGLCDAAIGVIIIRTYTAFDEAGNQSELNCIQQITVTRPTSVDFPDDIAWYCSDVAANPNLIDATDLTCTGLVPNADLGNSLDATDLAGNACLAGSGSGFPVLIEGTYCNYAVTSDDENLSLCEDSDNTFKIIRTWTVLDWCSNTLITFNDDNNNGVQDGNEEDNVQIIKVIDDVAPVITIATDADLTLSTNIAGVHPQPCKTTEALPIPTITDDCSTFTYSVFTEVGVAIIGTGGAAYVPSPGLPIGTHDVTYVAIDQCGNTSELTITIEVLDDITPSAVCDEITQVAIGNDGTATVLANTFDDGSNDNCGIDRFEVRRMTDACAIVGNTQFGEDVKFCCADIGQTIMVVFRVYDYYDNIGECMVEVLVEDKLSPYKLSDAADDAITCDDYFSNIAPALDIAGANGETNPQILIDLFGEPEYDDNCEAIITTGYSRNVNSCGEGTITRNWLVIDPSGNVGPPCFQTIDVNHVNDWNVQFPADVDLVCIPDTNETDGVDFGEPTIFDDNCELISISSEDQLFTLVDDACYQILRTYTVINWCVYEGDNNDDDTVIGARRFRDGTDGIVTYIQEIKVQDDDAPVITNPGEQDYCLDSLTDADGDCDGNITLPEAVVTDCSVDITVTYVVTGLGTGRNYSDVAPGTYAVVVTATDNCGNQSSISYDAVVRDCKAPTPYCVAVLIIELMPDGTGGGMGEIWASDFNAGSFDNCTASEDLIITVNDEDDYDNSTPNLELNCGDVYPTNINQIYVYFEDEAGNVDYCLTTLIVESVPNICAAPSTEANIAGIIETEAGEGVELTTVGINGDMMSYNTDSEGTYSMDVPEGGDYTVVPTNDFDHDNGVTTFDIVLIRQHILTTTLLDSPYKMIAADANNSQSITTSDVVALRSLILNPALGLTANTSWKFVDANYTFPNPANPWSEDFPEVTGFNNLETEVNSDFIGVKVGDVNGSAEANQFSNNADERGTGRILFQTDDQRLVAGETYTVDFTIAEAVLGYQFTMNFATDKVDFIKVNNAIAIAENFGLAYLSEGALTTSVDFTNLQRINGAAFSLTFQAIANAQLSEVLSIDSRITTAEAYNETGVIKVELAFNNVSNDKFALYANTPNPFAEMTQIPFNLPIAEAGILTVTDVNGKVVTIVKGDFEAGRNTVTISDIIANGVYFYSIETATQSATRKMVKTD
ncbi:MAG: hypothetical protein ACI85O_001099 [Saprospiraceae bacterium]|jgi:hypothetical protein